MKKFYLSSFFFITFMCFVVFKITAQSNDQRNNAPGAPGSAPYWNYSGKTGIGTSYEKYLNGAYSDSHPETGNVNKVWFTIANGIITETAYGLISDAQIKVKA